MTKIIGKINPFDLIQTFYVSTDKQIIGTMQGKIEEVANIIFTLSEKYNTNQVNLSGSKYYIEGIIKKLEKEEKIRYNKNNLEFHYN